MKRKLYKFITNKYTIIVSLILITLLLRLICFPFESGDYNRFLLKWYNSINELGFSKIIDGIGNYNIPYLIIIYILTLLPGNILFKYKLVSTIFDIFIAILGIKIIESLNINVKKYILFFIILLLPTVVLNSSLWAQCDSIYTTFVLLSIYLALQDKYSLSFFSLGIAFSFKLQFIFILPLFVIIYFVNKKYSILNFLLIPIANIVMCIPALIAGLSIKDCFLAYFTQVSGYSVKLSRGLPNIYYIFYLFGIDNSINIVKYIMIIITMLIFLLLLIYFIKRKKKITKKEYISIGLLCVLICVYFLPFMHERYMYIADILSVLWYAIYRRKIYIPIVINISSLLGYINYLAGIKIVPFSIVAIILLGTIILLFKDIHNHYLD